MSRFVQWTPREKFRVFGQTNRDKIPICPWTDTGEH
uniref:Uncharacterized protein n=1 Tax=Siphoviridae sp. ctpoI7 TaxID=2825678 RepID=A0A8S5P8Z5_9CAUD|nr:MAG TPA: hypothetical protein [Siphoviridae sp. ctpoI7]